MIMISQLIPYLCDLIFQKWTMHIVRQLNHESLQINNNQQNITEVPMSCCTKDFTVTIIKFDLTSGGSRQYG